MNAATWILVLILAPTMLFIIWLVLLETSVKIDAGTIGLALLRGKSTGRTLSAGASLRPSVAEGDDPEVSVRASWRSWRVESSRRTPTSTTSTHPSMSCSSDHAVGRGQLHRALSTHPRQGAGDPRVVRTRRDLVGPARREPAHVDRRGAPAAAPRSATCSATGTPNSNAASPPRWPTRSPTSGFELKLFSLREIDLGVTGEIVQDTIRAGAELEREQAYAAVRRARIDNDNVLLAEVGGLDHELVLRYRQVDAWRDLHRTVGRRCAARAERHHHPVDHRVGLGRDDGRPRPGCGRHRRRSRRR